MPKKQEIIDDVFDAIVWNGGSVITIDKTSNEHVTRARDPYNQWDRNDTHTDHSFGNFQIAKGSYGDLTIGYTPRKNRTYYLVVVVYSTGHSYGHDSGSEVEYIDLYKTEDEARKTEKAIESNNGKNHECILNNSMGTRYKLYTGAWQGHFESLDYVDVISMELDE